MAESQGRGFRSDAGRGGGTLLAAASFDCLPGGDHLELKPSG